MEIAADRFGVVQPYTDRPDRLETAIVVSMHATTAAAFADLERHAERLWPEGIR